MTKENGRSGGEATARGRGALAGVLAAAALLAVPFASGTGRAAADPLDLTGGVFIVHAMPDITYTRDVPADGWCKFSDLTACDGIRAQAGERSSIWFVISAWSEPKRFSDVDFGLGDFDPRLFAFVDGGSCLPNAAITCAPDLNAWPGPNTGIGLASLKDPWEGNFIPIYWFAGYPYQGSGTIPLTEFAHTGHAGWISSRGRAPYDAVCLGALGVRAPGKSCCPQPSDSTSATSAAADSTAGAPDSTATRGATTEQ